MPLPGTAQVAFVRRAVALRFGRKHSNSHTWIIIGLSKCKVTCTLLGAITIATLFITQVTKSHDPPSSSGRCSGFEAVFRACDTPSSLPKPGRVQYTLLKAYTLNHNIMAPIGLSGFGACGRGTLDPGFCGCEHGRDHMMVLPEGLTTFWTWVWGSTA